MTPEILEIPKSSAGELFLNPSTGKFDNVLEGARATQLVDLIKDI